MTNKGAKIYITVLTLVTIAAVIFGIYFYIFRGTTVFSKAKNVSKTVSLEGDIDSIIFNMDAADLNIQYGESASVSYNLPEDSIPDISLDDGKLSVISKKNIRHFNINFFVFGNENKYDVTITVPTGTELSDVDLTTDAGDLDLKDISTSTLNIETDSGDLKLNSVFATDATIISDSADIDFENVDFSKSTIKTDAGDYKIKNSEIDDLDIESDAGDLKIDDSTIDNIKAEFDAGDIKAEDSTINSGSCKTDLGDIKLDGNIGDVSTSSDGGDIRINGDKK